MPACAVGEPECSRAKVTGGLARRALSKRSFIRRWRVSTAAQTGWAGAQAAVGRSLSRGS